MHHAGGPKRLNDGRVVILNEGIILSGVIADAGDVLGFSEHLPNVLSDLISSGCFDLDAQAVDLDWYISNPRIHNAIKLDARGDNEIAMLIAAGAGVAAGAAAHDIVPGCLSATAARDDVVQAQLAGGIAPTAILAAIMVAGVDISPIKPHLLARQPVVKEQAYDPRHGNG